jgi:hypothetical protein
VLPDSVKRLVAARALAGLMAGALFVFTFLATSGQFHRAFHCDGKRASSTCILCLFAKGQLDVSQAVPVFTPFIQASFDSAPWIKSISLVDSRYFLSPPRAPPALISLLTVLV